MRTIPIYCVLLPGISLAQTKDAQADGPIRQVIQRYMEARNHLDTAALRELFTKDADQLVSSGEWRRGLNNLLLGANASSRKENGQSSVTVESIRLLNPDTAIVDARYQTTRAGSTETRKMWSTFVLVQRDDHWLITAIRNMLPASAPH